MAILAILITSFLEQKHLINRYRETILSKFRFYIDFFCHKGLKNQREIRFVYFIACLPPVILLLLIKLLLAKYVLVYVIIKIFLFMLSVQILTWKDEAKKNTQSRAFITTYATKFFAALFWYMILPAAIGSVCYLVITLISEELKTRGLDLIVYNIVVDRMLFYVNLLPYFFLYLFIAVAGNFEEVTHYLVEQRSKFTKSYYFLEQVLEEVILIAIGKSKFQYSSSNLELADAGAIIPDKYNPKMNAYIVALLYRAGIFFIAILMLICFANLIR